MAAVLALLFSAPSVGQAETKLTASDAAAGDQFGISVAVDGNTAIAGAHRDNAAGIASGSAYVFSRHQGGADNWGQLAKLIAVDQTTNDSFGFSVAVDGDTVIIGAPSDDDGAANSGSVYVFQRNQGGADNWGFITKINADDAGAFDSFGFSVAVDGDTAIVGAPANDDGGGDSGSAYIFGRNQGGADNWGQVAKLTADDAAEDDRFGESVSVHSDMAIVGARRDDDGGSDSGAAYVFGRNEGGADSWGQLTKLTADDVAAGDQFGISVAVHGDMAIVGAQLDDDGGTDSGSAYVFRRNQGGADNWGQLTKLTADDAAAVDRFGISVSIHGDTAIVGAHRDDDGGSDSGAAYLFGRNEGGADNWGQLTKLTADDAAEDDWFGFSVSLASDTAIVGAYLDDDGGDASGSAYVFDVPAPSGLRLDIPDNVIAVAGESVDVPVVLNAAGHALAATAFSIDYDEACLDFDPTDANADGIPDAMVFDVAADFTSTVFVDLGDADGEIDIAIADAAPPFASLADGTLVTLTFTATCTPAAPATILAPVRFSTDPTASFSDAAAQDIPGATEDGSVEIFSGLRGDCNASGQITAADLIACASEVFDGDGTDWLAVPGGSFPGDPVGCDANADARVDAGDLTCKIRLIFGLTCGGGTRAVDGQQPTLRPWLGLPSAVTVNNGILSVDVRLTPHTHALNATIFALDYDETRLAFDPTDGDGDGLPDAVQFLGTSVSTQSVVFDAARTDGELSVLVADLVQNPQLLIDGPLVRIEFEVLDASAPLATALRFSPSLTPSFGSVDGRSVPGLNGYGEAPFFEDGFESGTVDAWMP